MGLELIKGPLGNQVVDAGMFQLPPAFDTKIYAAEWVEEGQVQYKRQRQNLPQTGYSADGWEIWKLDPKDKATTVTNGSNKKFVLMCRPRLLQDKINALYGNVSKAQINREVLGETVAGGERQDPGILTEAMLKRKEGGGSLAEDSTLQLNQVEEPTATVAT